MSALPSVVKGSKHVGVTAKSLIGGAASVRVLTPKCVPASTQTSSSAYVSNKLLHGLKVRFDFMLHIWVRFAHTNL